MADQLEPLVLTPHPVRGESLLGFVLRLSEANGYERPADILRYSGMTENEAQSARLPLDKLALLCGCSIEELEPLTYTHPSENKNVFSLLGHALTVMHVQIKRAKICPDCVKDNGYIDVFWDLRYAVACPVHGRVALKSCPACGQRITWARPGLLRCACNHELAHVSEAAEISDKVAALLEVIWRKLHGKTLSSARIAAANFPLEALDAMALRTLLGLVERLGRFARGMKAGDEIAMEREMLALEVAAEVFGNWPHGLYEFLDEFASRRLGPVAGHFGLRKQFERFYNSMFNSNLSSKQMGFMREAFISFGLKHWKKGILDKKLLRKAPDYDRQIVGINEAAAALGVQPVTIRHMVRAGLIKPIVLKKGGKQRLLIDLSQELPHRAEKGKSLGYKEAGRLLGLPASVLIVLREQRVFKMQYLGDRIGSFHEKDLIRFRDEILGKIPRIDRSVAECGDRITINEIMRMKLGSPVHKAECIAAMARGEIQPLGRLGEDLASIVFKRMEIVARLRTHRASATGMRIATDAARMLRCTYSYVPFMVKEGLLQGKETKKGLLITEDSLHQFSKQYISCAWVAQHLGTRSTRIINICNTHGAQLLRVKRSHREPSLIFLMRQDLPLLGIKELPLFFGIDQQSVA